MQQKPVFFHFYDLTTEMDYRIQISCTSKDWENWSEDDIEKEDSFIAELEMSLAVHDIDCVCEEEYELVGYNTYEADEEEMKEILKRWKEKLLDLKWINEEDEFQALKIPQDDM